MPEGPEIRLTSLFVNRVCLGKHFAGEVIKSAVSKLEKVSFTSPRYTIAAEARGKEFALLLSCQERKNDVRLLFRFGMTGRFCFTPATELPKHAHLQFYTFDSPQHVLSFVDSRRFGSWRVSDSWGNERGPDPMTEHDEFKENILSDLDKPVFERPICEVLLYQKYFNGIGNYLRAEVLYRAGIPPFTCARDALSIDQDNDDKSSKTPSCSEAPSCGNNLLQLLHDVPMEVVNLKLGRDNDIVLEEDYTYQEFMDWLQCYGKPTMNKLVDHNRRTIWFKGPAGPLAPKVKRKKRSRTKQGSQSRRKRAKQLSPPPDTASHAGVTSTP